MKNGGCPICHRYFMLFYLLREQGLIDLVVTTFMPETPPKEVSTATWTLSNKLTPRTRVRLLQEVTPTIWTLKSKLALGRRYMPETPPKEVRSTQTLNSKLTFRGYITKTPPEKVRTATWTLRSKLTLGWYVLDSSKRGRTAAWTLSSKLITPKFFPRQT